MDASGASIRNLGAMHIQPTLQSMHDEAAAAALGSRHERALWGGGALEVAANDMESQHWSMHSPFGVLRAVLRFGGLLRVP